MFKVVYVGAYIIAEFFSLYCLMIFYSCYLEKEELTRFKKSIIWFAIIALYILPNYLFGNWVLNLSAALTSFILMTCLYKGNMKYKIMMAFFGCMISLVSELGTMVYWKLFFGQFEGDFYNIVFLAICRIINFAIIECICLSNKKQRKIFYQPYYWWLVVLIPGGSTYIICKAADWVLENPAVFGELPVLVFIIILLVINISVFYLYDKLVDSYMEVFYMEQINSQNKVYLAALEKEVVNIKNLRTWRHNIINFLQGLTGPARNNDCTEVIKMINHKLEEFQQISNMKYSGNTVIDSIISYKKDLMDQNKIIFEGEFVIPDKIEIESNDLAILVGNTLDNAIEDRKIRMFLRYSKDVLYYKIENMFLDAIPDKHLFRTTKKSFEDHGLGL